MKKETMFMIGAGVLGFIAVRYFLKNKNKGEESSNYIGTATGSQCRINIGGKVHTFNCGETVGAGSLWEGFSANCTGTGSFGCTVSNGMTTYNGTKVRQRVARRTYSSACGCGA
jgi:hypothetical protein